MHPRMVKMCALVVILMVCVCVYLVPRVFPVPFVSFGFPVCWPSRRKLLSAGVLHQRSSGYLFPTPGSPPHRSTGRLTHTHTHALLWRLTGARTGLTVSRSLGRE